MSLDFLNDGIKRLGLELRDEQIESLANYAMLLARWTKTYNLTSVRDLLGIVKLHLLDSLAVVPHLPRDDGNILDVGSGGGLPGIPLAIACPSLAVTLLDSNSKKSAFQRQAVIELALKNVSVVTSRVESFVPTLQFDQIISRAYSEISEFVAQTQPLRSEQGVWLAMKGITPSGELSRLPPTVVVRNMVSLDVPGVDAERCLIVLGCADNGI